MDTRALPRSNDLKGTTSLASRRSPSGEQEAPVALRDFTCWAKLTLSLRKCLVRHLEGVPLRVVASPMDIGSHHV